MNNLIQDLVHLSSSITIFVMYQHPTHFHPQAQPAKLRAHLHRVHVADRGHLPLPCLRRDPVLPETADDALPGRLGQLLWGHWPGEGGSQEGLHL